MDSSVKKIIVGVLVGILVCTGIFFAYEKGYKTKPLRFDAKKVQMVSIMDLKSGYAATIYEKDKIEDTLNTLKNLKVCRSLAPVDDIKATQPSAVITISTTEEKKKKKKTENSEYDLFGDLGVEMPSMYSVYEDNFVAYDEERIYSIKPSEYEKITEVCKKYGEYNELYQNLLNGLSGLADELGS